VIPPLLVWHLTFLAVKCNPDPLVLCLLAKLGTGFDCASKGEIETILNLGVEPSRIIYAQPCKAKSFIRYAAEQGVKQMTFDNSDELYKINRFFPDAELLLRILTDDSSSLCRLSDKFGASMGTTKELLNLAKALDLNVVGVSFHVGSGASDPQSFAKAVQDSRMVFDEAAESGYDMKVLDVGGGFSGDLFEAMADVLSKALDEYFPPSVCIIGEPGRFYVSSAFTLACNIIARREIIDPATHEPRYMLYLNDGVYGNFASLIYDHQVALPRILSKSNQSIVCTRYSLWGPSCDGIDRITESCVLQGRLNVGDWLYFEEMGAYTSCCATKFNGFNDNHDVLYVSSDRGAAELLLKEHIEIQMENGLKNASIFPSTVVTSSSTMICHEDGAGSYGMAANRQLADTEPLMARIFVESLFAQQALHRN
jgi:ornithine decarboxylase